MPVEVDGADLTMTDLPAASTQPIAVPDFAQLYSRFYRIVHRWASSLGGGSDAEDLAQEIFVIVRRKLAEFDGDNETAWLYQITRRTVRDHRRRVWFRRVLLGATELDVVQDAGDDAAAQLERKQAQQRFYRIASRMHRKWRESFLLFEVAGHSGEEIAALLHLPPATVRTHLQRARKQFLALVAEERDT